MAPEDYATFLTRRLAPLLGQQKSELLVMEAAGVLKIDPSAMSREDALRVLARIREKLGLVRGSSSEDF